MFPFNVFGIIKLPASFWKSLHEKLLKIVVFTFDVSREAEIIRSEYYRKSGFPNLKMIRSKDGVRFIDSKGLNSIAYSENWFASLFAKHQQIFRSASFSNIGKAYFNF